MTKRRIGSIPQRVHLTPQTVERVDTYAAHHNIPSFSATIEQLVRMGLEQSPAEIVAPIIVSTMRKEFNRHIKYVVKLILYDIVETGMARRLAGAAVRDIGRLKQDDPDRYEKIKAAALLEAQQTLERTHLDRVLRQLDVYAGADQNGHPVEAP